MKNLVRLMLVAMLSTMVALPAVASKARHVKQAHEGWSMVVSTGLNWFVGGYGNAASDANSGFSWSLAYHLNKDTSLWLTPAFTLSSVGDAYKGFSATAGANYVVNRTLGF